MLTTMEGEKKNMAKTKSPSQRLGLTKYLTPSAVIAMVMTIAGVSGSFAFQGHACRRFPKVVRTKYGWVKGYYTAEKTVAWTGVPFAKPPVGALRWKAPQAPERWRGILDATQGCIPCTQLYMTKNWQQQSYVVGSEDCLYLSIYRPDNFRRNLPVYVYIHGGSNYHGTANDYDGSRIAAKSDMVVVIVQHRLGPLGWFTHPALRHGRSPLDDSGNFGTLDNIQALRWIRGNIRGFGGNPRNVTITGESAGAHNVMSMVISPLAKGLFHKAMSESGGMSTIPVAVGETLAESTIDKLLAKDRLTRDEWESWTPYGQEAYLRGQSNRDLLEVLYGSVDTYNAYEDGVVIPGSVMATIRSGKYNKVPIILGANQYELKALMPLYGPALGLPWLNLIAVLDGAIPSIDDVLPTQLDKDLYEVTGYYGGRNWRAKYVDERARALKEQQNQVWAYQFNWGGPGSGPSPFDFIYGAGHAMEIAFFFGSDQSLWGYGYNRENDTPGRVALSDAMMKYLANFAYTGNPNGWGLPIWQKWSNGEGEPKNIVFDADYSKAILGMSNEEVDIVNERAKLEEEIAQWPEFYQNIARLSQLNQPE